MANLLVARKSGLLPGTHNGHSQLRPAFKSYRQRMQSRPSFKRAARAQKTRAMPLLPRRKVRTGEICSTIDGVIGFLDRYGCLRRSANNSQGRHRTSAATDSATLRSPPPANPRYVAAAPAFTL